MTLECHFSCIACLCVSARVAGAAFRDLRLPVRAAGQVFSDVGAGGYSTTSDYVTVITVQGLLV